MIMSWGRTSSSPNLDVLSSSSSSVKAPSSDLSFEGISAEIKLLQKLIQDHHHASTKDLDARRPQLLSSILTVLDHLKTKIQSSGRPELRRCHSDLRSPAAHAPASSNENDHDHDQLDSLRRELHASVVARKSLEAMCSSLGKEKGIIASELARKVHQLKGLEEHVEDLRAQNDSLLAKLQANKAVPVQADLQDRNKALSDQLLKSLDGYRSLKRKYKGAREENRALVATMVEMGAEVAQARQCLQPSPGPPPSSEHVSALHHLLQGLHLKISKHVDDRDDPSASAVSVSS